MSTPITITVDGKEITTVLGRTILDVCRENGISIPVLCEFKGLSTVGACRICLVEIEGSPKLFPSCTTPVAANQKIKTNSDRLRKYQRMTVELLFSERNHVCSVCIANNACELQDLAYSVGMTKVRFPYLYPECGVDGSHRLYLMDHNRCIMCTRCVRVCDEVEGAHNWDVMGRGTNSRITSDFNQPWGESTTCTDCGKCIDVCPTGALVPKAAAIGTLAKAPDFVKELVAKRKFAGMSVADQEGPQPNMPTFYERRKKDAATNKRRG